MKSYKTISAIGITSLLSFNLNAAPMYLTFDGYVSSVQDSAGIISEAGVNIGDSVSFVVYVDYERLGENTRNDGGVVYSSDGCNNVSCNDFYYVDLASDTLLSEKDGGFYNEPYNNAKYNTGEFISFNEWHVLNIGSTDNYLYFWWYGLTPITSWSVGHELYGYESAYDSTGLHSNLSYTLTLADITAVPVPSEIWLSGSGLISLIGFARRGNA